MSKYKTAAIVLSAGQGKRMGSNIPKQYLSIHGKPILYYSLKAFEESIIDQVILVVGKGDIDYCKENVVCKYGFQKVTHIIEGGRERYHSVYNGLRELNRIDYVLIHDGARPFIQPTLIQQVVEQVSEFKACVVGMPVKDTIKIADANGMVDSTPPRDRLWMIQTPQAFDYKIIRQAYDELINKKNIAVTDDAMVLELMGGYAVKLVEGSYQNIKITTPEDIQIAELFLAQNNE